MTTHGDFLCGCSPQSKRHYSGNNAPSPIPGADPMYTDKRFDDQGFEVCPEHGERMYGFLSPPASDQAQSRPDFSKKGKRAKWVLSVQVEDHRDNRDPETVYAELKASRAGGNGHGL